MKHAKLLVLCLGLIALGCQKDPIDDGSGLTLTPQAPTDLAYSPVINAREFSAFLTGPPTYNSYGAVPTFQIVGLRDEAGTAINADDIATYASIINPTDVSIPIAEGDTVIVPNSENIGQIIISDENPLGVGKYFFDIKMTTEFDDQVFEATFSDVLEINLGPQLASGLIYIPGGQNLLSGSSDTTTKPLVFGANPDLSYELGDNTDKLTIDPQTGQIGVLSGYQPITEPEIVSPTINVVSNISGEVVSFTDVVQIYISTNPVEVPKATINLFYPTFEAENTAFGYRIETVVPGDADMTWNQANPSPVTAGDRPAENVNQKRISINLVKPSAGEQVPHESWVILNAQDLSGYEFGFRLEAEFYTKNRFVEYLSTDGTAPSLMRFYVSTDYNGNFNNATWTDVSDELVSNIEVDGAFDPANDFVGFPYPGDQQDYGFPDPDNLKNPLRNGDNVFTKSILNLADYIGQTNVTFAFRVNTTFEGTLSRDGNVDRSGQYWLEDFHITAFEL
ncbi:MAG: hypothetical protein AAF804_04525 [Bacteroidota bacterium]